MYKKNMLTPEEEGYITELGLAEGATHTDTHTDTSIDLVRGREGGRDGLFL